MIDTKTKLVVIGGGTGSFTVLSGLKKYFKNITAVISMADDGGSTGRLIDEYGVLPPGDIRQCLVALATAPKARELFSYRFDEGCFAGHCFGNIFLTATEKLTGNFTDGVKLAGKLLQVVGRVEPVTFDKAKLVINNNGQITKGQRAIESIKVSRPDITFEPLPTPNPATLRAIKEANLVIIAPGSLYDSLGAVLAVPGVGTALQKTKAKIIYVCNLVNKPGHTDGFSPVDFANELERIAGTKFLNIVLYNTNRPTNELLKKYAADSELPVTKTSKNDHHFQLKGANLLEEKQQFRQSKADQIKRTLIRHDPELIAKEILKVVNN